MRFVIDCSVAVKWVVGEADSDIALQLLRQDLYAPEFIYLESANALWKLAKRGEASGEQAAYKLLALRQIKMHTLPVGDVVARALDIGCKLRHPVYDCLYLATAEMCSARVVTVDDRLLQCVSGSSLAHLAISLQEAAAN